MIKLPAKQIKAFFKSDKRLAISIISVAALLIAAAVLFAVILSSEGGDLQQAYADATAEIISVVTSHDAVSFTDEPVSTPDIPAPTQASAPTPAPTEELNTESPSASATAPITPEPTRDPALEIGQYGEYIASLQDRLMELGYLDIDEPTSYYGSTTAYAVKLFQRQHGLEMDGYAGQDTLTLLFSNSAQHYAMKLDTEGLDVQNLQQQLKDLGYLEGAVDGFYGEQTKEAVMAFQSRNELAINGVAGEKTLEKLFSPDANPALNIMPEEIRKVNIQTMLNVAYQQLGKRYVLGGNGPNVFDCSGLVYYCLKQAGSTRGRYDAAGYSVVGDWELIRSMDDLEVGDLLFFYNNKFSKVGHVGIYIGDGMMIDASSSNGKVVCRSCTTYYWQRHFARARRPWG